MPELTDPTFEFARQAEQAALRTLIQMGEAGKKILDLQVKATEDNIRCAQRALGDVAGAQDWNAFHGMPARILAEQTERNADLARELGRLVADLESTFLEQLRAGAEQWGESQRNALAQGGGLGPWQESVKAMFGQFSQFMPTTGGFPGLNGVAAPAPTSVSAPKARAARS